MRDSEQAPDRRAEWITSAAWKSQPDGPLPVVGAVFRIAGLARSATLRIAGLGVFVASINGRVVSDPLEPGYSDYAQRAEFCTYDVSALLTTGDNTVTIELGPGCYRSRARDNRWAKIVTDYGDLGTCATLDWVDDRGEGAVRTDTAWHGTTGPVRSSNWVGGEDYDAGEAYDTDPGTVRSWPRAVHARIPDGMTLSPKAIPPLRVHEHLPARTVTEPRPGVHVVDFGVNFAGWVELDLPPRVEVTLRPAELLDAAGDVNPVTEGWGPVFHTVRTADADLTWRPRFAYNGLRYLEIAGLSAAPPASSVRGLVLAADAEATGTFTASDRRLSDLHTIIRRAITSNMFSMFTDCPQREKLGYLEQLHLVYPILRWNFDVQALLENTLRITREAQEADGHIPLYVPEWDPFPDPWRGDVNFGLVIVFLPWQLYRSYGDKAVLADNYTTAARYLEYLLSSRVDGLVTYGLGDWNGRDFRFVPFVATATLARALGVMAATSAVLGRTTDARRWADEQRRMTKRVRANFVQPDGRVGTGTVAELAVAIHNGVLTETEVPRAVQHLEDRIIADGCYLDVGEVAMAALVEVLSAHDRHETLYRLTQVDEQPGYGYMLRHGATSLTETWDGPTFGYSQNHFMNGAIDDWFFAHVAGLQQATGDVGFRDVVVRPRPCGKLTSAAATYRARSGLLSSAWVRDGSTFTLEVTVPAASTATVELPDGSMHRVAAGSHRFNVRIDEERG
jgi:alpha-L-rhamnosidase